MVRYIAYCRVNCLRHVHGFTILFHDGALDFFTVHLLFLGNVLEQRGEASNKLLKATYDKTYKLILIYIDSCMVQYTYSIKFEPNI